MPQPRKPGGPLPRPVFIEHAGLKGVPHITLLYRLVNHITYYASTEELLNLRAILSDKSRPLPPIPPTGMADDSPLCIQYCARALAYPSLIADEKLNAKIEKEIREIIELIEKRLKKFSLRSTKKVQVPFSVNKAGVCGFFVNLWLVSTYEENISAHKRRDFYRMLNPTDPIFQSTDKKTVIEGIYRKATTTPSAAPYLGPGNMSDIDLDNVGAYQIPFPLAGIMPGLTKTFGINIIQLIRTMSEKKINMLSIVCRLSSPGRYAHSIGLFICFQTPTSLIKVLIYDPNDKLGHHKLYINRIELLGPCEYAIDEMQKYIAVICVRMRFDVETTPTTLFCFKTSSSAALPFFMPQRVWFPSQEALNDFVSTTFTSILAEMGRRDHNSINRYMIQMLVDTKAKLNPLAHETVNFVLLIVLAEFEFNEIIDIIVEGSPATETTLSIYNKALGKACCFSNVPIVEALIRGGAQINSQDQIGCTPLHWAANSGKLEIVRKLLELGADRNIQAHDKQTPLDYARAKNFPDIVTLLESSS